MAVGGGVLPRLASGLRGHDFALAMLAYPLVLLYVLQYLGFEEVALPMHGGELRPEAVRALAARIPGARFELVEAGHLMPVQMPGELARRVGAFLPG